jgi:hypothetical protein
MQDFLATEIGFDPNIVVKDKDDKPIMFVAVKASRVYEAEEFTLYGLENYQHVPFLMYVNTKYIRIYQAGNSEPIEKLNVLEILKFYDPGFHDKKMRQPFVMALIQAWLRDLAYHWNSPNPPAMKEIEEIGFLKILDNGITEELDW